MFTLHPRVRDGAEHDPDDREAGTSMLEVVVGMALMSIFMAMFTGAILLMTKSTSKAESMTNVSTQTNNAFLKLDKIVRYAADISTPGQSGGSGAWYVEISTTNTGPQLCTQFRIDLATNQLQQRSWTVLSTGAATPMNPAWIPLAGQVTNGDAAAGSTQPFQLSTGSGAVYEQLTVRLQTTDGSANTTSTNNSTVTFSAVNSSLSNTAATPCQQLGRP
ncbi:hypothetical protein M6D93_05925 [Jatrophihabitans telluris]|uniref:Prepilin-type N-terminal cleavage/methylation domain-containing protein n=1 Tax=Jatrophihabitans telluris TaxID=2038343 RepID=A0ABY4R3E4_9ACTN|nr:hypothetical protein [Jatrophihabitans telluris]UQX89544.1 hypothetical protein M6D93_05925 [Jatrophihabitans telluris]